MLFLCIIVYQYLKGDHANANSILRRMLVTLIRCKIYVNKTSRMMI